MCGEVPARKRCLQRGNRRRHEATSITVIQSNLSDEASILSLFTRTLPTALYSGLVGMPLLRMADFWGVLRRED